MIYFNGKESTPKLNGVDLSRVMHNGKQIWPKIGLNANAGDYVLWDKTNLKKVIVPYGTDLNNYSADNYTPIGVVVVPASHDVYGDGSCGVMSLKEMNYDSPDTGSTSYQKIYWGGYGTDISQLDNLYDVCYIGTGSSLNENVQGTYSYCYLPSDRFSDVDNPYDPGTGYYSSGSSYRQAPSPYKADGTRNPAYYQTSSPSSSANALADFDGIGNSEVLWDLATSQTNWKTASSITNNSGAGYYPAACCCWRYHTDGTGQGSWYLPACGELGYIMPRFNKINETITNLRNAYGSSIGVTLNTRSLYWPSSEYSSDSARHVDTGYGIVRNYNKSYGYYVRAFLKVSPSDL